MRQELTGPGVNYIIRDAKQKQKKKITYALMQLTPLGDGAEVINRREELRWLYEVYSSMRGILHYLDLKHQ